MTVTLNVALGDRSYPILIGRRILGELPGLLQRNGNVSSVGIVTDTNVAALLGTRVAEILEMPGLRTVTHILPAGEEHKRLENIEAICGTFLSARLDRSSVIVALGGGVVGDMAGFAAAIFMRGIPFVQIPTTIVAQVDSSVGGKTGVNHPIGKNTLGAFHQPSGVLIDMALLETLPERELRAGLAEVIKHGIIADDALLAHMEYRAGNILAKDLTALEMPVVRSCEIKAAIVAEDEHEHGVRANLNYGHTFGHAFEAVTHYKHFLHGEAIALGMCAAAELAVIVGMSDRTFADRQRACIARYGLPVHWPQLPVEESLAAMSGDKKARGGKLKFILAAAPGNVVQRTDITPDQVRGALERVKSGD